MATVIVAITSPPPEGAPTRRLPTGAVNTKLLQGNTGVFWKTLTRAEPNGKDKVNRMMKKLASLDIFVEVNTLLRAKQDSFMIT